MLVFVVCTGFNLVLSGFYQFLLIVSLLMFYWSTWFGFSGDFRVILGLPKRPFRDNVLFVLEFLSKS